MMNYAGYKKMHKYNEDEYAKDYWHTCTSDSCKGK
jgi:hypothetical protein